MMRQLEFRAKKSGVPILKDDDIDRDVIVLLHDYNPDLLETPQALDVEDFAERFLGLDIHYEYLSHNGCIWGRMVFNDRLILVYDPDNNSIAYHPVDANTIVVDNSLLEGTTEYALRSTIAHECGHGLYHPQIYREDDNQLSFFPVDPKTKLAASVCRKEDISGSSGGKKELVTDHDWVEHHAKYFSAALLMNKAVMLKVYGDIDWRCQFLRENGQHFVDGSLVTQVARTFNVSPTSARIRLSKLGLLFEQNEFAHTHIGYEMPMFYQGAFI